MSSVLRNSGNVFMLVVDEESCYLQDNHKIIDIKKMRQFGEQLIEFADKHTDEEIDEANEQFQIEERRTLLTTAIKANKKPEKPRHIYLFKNDRCYYKIGISLNIPKRIHDLERRADTLTLIYNTPLIKDAFIQESRLHRMYNEQRVKNEWFNFSDEFVQNNVIPTLKKISQQTSGEN